jgi:hypothetical protein
MRGCLVIKRPGPGGRRDANPAQRGYRSSRLTSTVSTTEATTENSTMNKQPNPPPSGRISRFPKRMPDDLPPTRTANHRAGRALWTPHQTCYLEPNDLSPTSVPALLDHPFDHPDDPTGPDWIRPDRRGLRREQARSVWSRPDRRRAPAYGPGAPPPWPYQAPADLLRSC